MKTKTLNRNFILLIIGQASSMFGTVLLKFTVSLLILDLTRSAALFGTITAISYLPPINAAFILLIQPLIATGALFIIRVVLDLSSVLNRLFLFGNLSCESPLHFTSHTAKRYLPYTYASPQKCP